MARGSHPYNVFCIGECNKQTPHIIARHHSGERVYQCSVCMAVRPIPARKPKIKKNPAPLASEVVKAKRLYRQFSGHNVTAAKTVRLPKAPNVGLAIGPVIGIMYETVRDGAREKYLHKFKARSRPLLVTSHDGKTVMLLGGAFTFTDRGIVDDPH